MTGPSCWLQKRSRRFRFASCARLRGDALVRLETSVFLRSPVGQVKSQGRSVWPLRLSCALGLSLAATGGCQTESTGASGAGQGGLTLNLAGANTIVCPASAAGEGGVAALAGEGGAPANCAASAPVDYASQVAPILATCQGEVCHDFSDLSLVRAFIAAPADECCNQRELIAPGRPDRSYLVDKLRGRRLCYGSRMPLNRGPLPASDLSVLEAWICQGAALP